LRRIGLLCGLLLLVACDTLPHPFRHQGQTYPLARPDLEATDGADIQPPPPRRLTARLGEFSGLPGDGNQSLRRALKSALERRGLLVVGENPDVIITPTLGLNDGGANGRGLDLTWVVTTKAATLLGQASQQGQASTAQIMGQWGTLARDIAEGGADGIIEIVRSAFTNGGLD
jgi:hypothetical protein